MLEPEWLSLNTVLAVHDAQIAEHGGLPGIKDQGLLEAALDRPKNRFAYGAPDIATLAACYAYGISKNHGFADGNKRTSNVAAITFLELNGYELQVRDDEQTTMWLQLADDAVTEDEFAGWLRTKIIKITP
jgi:death on curing protein